MKTLLKSRKGVAFLVQVIFYLICLVALWTRPEIRSPEVLTWMTAAGLCLASYHVTQGVVDFKHGAKPE